MITSNSTSSGSRLPNPSERRPKILVLGFLMFLVCVIFSGYVFARMSYTAGGAHSADRKGGQNGSGESESIKQARSEPRSEKNDRERPAQTEASKGDSSAEKSGAAEKIAGELKAEVNEALNEQKQADQFRR